MMRKHNGMRPQDIVVLIKLILDEGKSLNYTLSLELGLSPAEITLSIERCKYAGLLSEDRKVIRQGFLEFLTYGMKYTFPARPAELTTGMPTAQSAPPLYNKISSPDAHFVWKSEKGTVKGQAIEPFYPKQLIAAQRDLRLYEILALLDVIRTGTSREIYIAVELLRKKILI